MSKLIIDSGTLTSIGNAIREKTGKLDLLSPSQMATEISNISVGGGTGGNDNEWITGTYPAGNYHNDIELYELPRYKFNDNTRLTSITMPNIESIGQYAFHFCTNLEEVNFPKVTGIQSNAFFYCEKLKRVNMPLLERVSGQAFTRCEALEEICLPSATNSYDECFKYCLSLRKCDFPVMTNIATDMFYGCTNLEALILRSETVATLSSTSVLQGTKIYTGGGRIYVPRDLVESYKAATNWTTYADKIVAIEDNPEVCGLGGTQL